MGGRTNSVAVLGLVAVLVAAPLASILPGAVADETVSPTIPSVTRQEVRESALRGLEWFAAQQSPDGAWAGSTGVTGLVLLCFAGAGYDYTNRTVQKGLGFMRNFYNADEAYLADSYPTYETAIALMAMTACNDPEDADKIPVLAAGMQTLQFPNNDYNVTADWYPGGWPNYAGIPDISNSQFGLMGLQAVSLYDDPGLVDPVVWDNSTTFSQYCQNWPDLNPMEWAHNESLPSHEDGGFVYNAFRSRTPAGESMFESYGSITAAGLYSYLVCGNDPRQPEVRAAREWLDFEYNLEVNPRMVGKGLYYYLWSQARALAMSPQDWVVDGSGKLHDWRADVANFFMGLQHANGGWPGNPQTGWREEEPELASMYAILSMLSGYLLVPNPQLEIVVQGGGGASFIDDLGHRLTTDVTQGITVTDTTFKCTDPEIFRKVWVTIDGTEASRATVTATGTWGEGRSSTTSRKVLLGSEGGVAHVAASGFVGPFAVHINVFDDAPHLGLEDVRRVELKSGETMLLDIGLEETTGQGPVNGLVLVIHAGEGVVADVDRQGVSIPSGTEGTMGLTLSLAANATWQEDWTIVITSSTAPPVALDVGMYDEPAEIGFTTMYWVLLAIILVVVLAFFILPSRGRASSEPATIEGVEESPEEHPEDE